MKLTERQKGILHKLLDRYEASATYRGENRRRQTFSVAPDEMFPAYYLDSADVLEVEDFESQLSQMEEAGLIALRRAKNGEIRRIIACPDRWEQYRTLLHRRDRNDLLEEEMRFYETWRGAHPITDGFCEEQIQRLRSGKKALYRQEDAACILRLCARILSNRQDLLERELSISVLGDSKLFEKKYRERVCRLLQRDPSLAALVQEVDDRRERESITLGEFSVYANPSYLYLKGDGEIRFSDGYCVRLRADTPAAFLASRLMKAASIRVAAEVVVTVENLTSFNRIQRPGHFYLFLSGYHNTAKQNLIKLIAAQNPGLSWRHFGDIDPDGFLIAEHLQRGTGLAFQTVHMGVEDLIRYSRFTKPLEANDLKKANTLIRAGKYVDVLEYMLEHNVKLEQEIISWQERTEPDRADSARAAEPRPRSTPGV